ncbi:MAG: transposase family protein [Clostridiales bacterium]|jgi:hypothetical protein|nr:transposase family protein [Clostridiales bacterium]
MERKRPMTRKESRDELNKFNLACELLKTIRHFFPDLVNQLHRITDERDQRYIRYELELILCVRILSVVFLLPSMRSISEEMNNDIIISNISKLLHRDDITELPHFDTINKCLIQIPPIELEAIICEIANRLIRSKTFLESRIRNRCWQIVIDGTRLYSFSEQHCIHCLFKEHKDRTGNVTSVEYYHYVLEAKLVLRENIVISIATEFVENNGTQQPGAGEKAKQDCELKSFYRMADKLKAAFPRLPVCLTMDSLYACEPVFQICGQNNWRYIIRFKDGSIKTVAEEFHVLKNLEAEQCLIEADDKSSRQYKFVLKMDYHGFMLNAAECIETKSDGEKRTFVFITDLSINQRNCAALVKAGRCRWRIERKRRV